MRRRWTWTPCVSVACGIISLAAVVSAQQAATNQSAYGQLILDDFSNWRTYLAVSPPFVGKTAAEAKPEVDKPRSPAPPTGWTAPDFEDSAWPRTGARIFEGYGWTHNKPGGQQWASQFCLRGKFVVNDPAAVKSLRFSAAYRGGIVVYVNGTEVARGHIPEGAVTSDTCAQEYPWEAYVNADGKGLTKRQAIEGVVRERLNLRIRRLEDIPLPVNSLRKGVNVIAVDLRRAPIDPRAKALGWESYWGTMGLMTVCLAAPDGGAVPNLVRPQGVQVWNADPMTAVFDCDFADPNEPLRPVRLTGTKGAAFSGQVVVGSDQPIVKLTARISDLVHAKDTGKIAASEVKLRYPLPNGFEAGKGGRYRGIDKPFRFDAMLESAPEKVSVSVKNVRREYAGLQPVHGAVQPVWITVKIPRDAAAGEYTGTLTVSAEGLAPLAVPVQLGVADWKAPDAREFESHVGLTGSPETLALYYKKPMWSEEHWALIAHSLQCMGEAGCNALFLPLVAKHHYGKESMVRWIRKAGGGYGYDFTVFDRYVDLALKHMASKPQVVVLYAWEPCRSVWKKEKDQLQVTTTDPDTKEAAEIPAPAYDAPEAVAFWRPVMEAVRERLVNKGVPEKSLMVGMASDTVPSPQEVDLFKKAAPWARWVKQAHGDVGQFGGVPVGHLAFVWGTQGLKDPSEKRLYYWRTEQVRTIFPRAGACKLFRPEQTLCNAWTLQEYLVAAGYRGIGRIGADFWPISKGGRHYGGDTMAGLYANWGQTTISESSLDLLYPSPGGAVMTLRLETYRQGLYNAEARIVIDKALNDKAVRARLGGELAGRAQELLDRRARLMIAYDGELQPWYQASGWQASDKALLALAGEVAAKANAGTTP